MLTAKRAADERGVMERITSLYNRAFPANERRPLEPLINDRTGHGEIIAFYDGDVFCGFACLLTWRDISHIIYFAIEDELRGRGYGGQALEIMYEMKAGCRMIVDVEAERPDAENNAKRISRINFYRRNGYRPTEVRYNWREEDYLILSRGGDVTGDEFHGFWEAIDADNHVLSQY